MPWRLRLTDMLGRALRRWQPKGRLLDRGVAKTALVGAAAVALVGRWLMAPPARCEPSGPGAGQAARP
jgi:hypothetical protein